MSTGKPHPMLIDDRVVEMVRANNADLEAHLAAISMTLTPDDCRRIARLAIRVDILRQRAWTMDNRKARSIDAKAIRIAVQQAERELDEAVARVRNSK